MPVSPDYPVTNITNPGQNDILCGRGGGTNAHPGNIKFRKLVAAHKLRYLAASKSDKPSVARDVVREWRSMEPPGRFLAKMDAKNIPPHLNVGDDDERPSVWFDVGDKKAREKASQCLRERNGAANEAVAALVKTVTASGEACPEDYATLMNKAALVKAKNELTIQQQNEMIKMNQQAQQMQQMGQMGQNMMGNGNMGGSGGQNNNFGQDSFEPISLQQQQSRGGRGGDFTSPQGSNNYQDANVEDDMIEAEIQRLLQQRQQKLMRNQNDNANSNGPGGNNLSNSIGNAGAGPRVGGGGGMMPNSGNDLNDPPQPYMGEESVMREYEQLMQKQRELNMMAGKLHGMMGNGNNNNNGMGGMMNNSGPGGMFNNNNMNGNMGNNNNNIMPQAPNSMGGMNNNGMGGMNNMGSMNNNNGSNMGGMNNNMNNFPGGNNQMPNQMGGMQSNHNPDAAKDYMKRLRMLRQGGGGGNTNNSMPDQATSSNTGGFNNSNNNNGFSGSGFMGNNNMGAGNNSNMMGNMSGNSMQQQMQGSKPREEFTIEEYQASLQQFLSHNDDYGGGSSRNNSGNNAQPDLMMSRNMSEATRQAGNTSLQQQQMMPGTIQCLQVPTNFDAGGVGNNKRNRRSSLRSVDDMDLPIGRNTFKSVDSNDRPSFQSMDDMDIRGTFKSVDTMDLMSIGNSINEIMDEDTKQNPEMRKKYGRRMSNAASRSGYDTGKGGDDGGNVGGYAQIPGQTLEIRTMDHGQGGRGGGGSKKKNRQGGGIDQRLPTAQAGTRHSVQTKGCDGPSTAGMGGRNSQLSIKDFNLDGADDASRMSFGNMSIMSELTDFQDMMAKAEAFQHGDSFKDL